MKEEPGLFKKPFILILFVFVLCNLHAQHAYVKKYRHLSDSLAEVYKIPAAVILSIAFVESSGGKGKAAKQLNNHFGIVGSRKAKKKHGHKSRYKYYNSPRESYIDFCSMISRKKFYKKLKGNKNVTVWVQAVSKTGYSQNPAVWQKRILSTISKHKLN